jgi:hypothetical protein
LKLKGIHLNLILKSSQNSETNPKSQLAMKTDFNNLFKKQMEAQEKQAYCVGFSKSSPSAKKRWPSTTGAVEADGELRLE